MLHLFFSIDGLFLPPFPFRHGQTCLIAVALTAKEGTNDYNWQLNCYKEAVGICPTLILTDADPGVTASIAEVLPGARHLWCLWHLHQNLRKNLGRILDDRYSQFATHFKRTQQHISESIFKSKYDELKKRWPEVVP